MRLKVKDTRGRVFKVADDMFEKQATKDAAELSSDEIKKLKKLIPHLDDLLVLLETENDDQDDDFDKDTFEVEETEVEEDVKDECVDELEVEDDETEPETVHDSKMSFGATERKKPGDTLSAEIDRDKEVALAWEKRYNGGN